MNPETDDTEPSDPTDAADPTESPEDGEPEVEGFGLTAPNVKGSMFDIVGGTTKPGNQASLTEDELRRLSGPR